MDPTEARDIVFRRAPEEWEWALGHARTIDNPWFCAQALGAVARWAPEASSAAIAKEAFTAAMSAPDAFNAVGSSAWPLRALVDRGNLKLARQLCEEALTRAKSVTPPPSHSEALFHVLNAVFSIPESRAATVEALVAAAQGARGWRVGRNMRDAILMVGAVDPEAAGALLARMPPSQYQRQAERRLAEGKYEKPRSFFGD